MAGHRGRSLLDEAQVGYAISQRGGYVDDGHVEPGHTVGIIGGFEPTRLQGPAQAIVVDVLYVGATGGEELDATGIQIEPHHVIADFDGPQGQRKPYIPLTDDDELGVPGSRAHRSEVGRRLMPALARSWWSVLRMSRFRNRTPGRGCGRWWRGPCRCSRGRAPWVQGSPRWQVRLSG